MVCCQGWRTRWLPNVDGRGDTLQDGRCKGRRQDQAATKFTASTRCPAQHTRWLLWLSQMTLCSKTARGMPSHSASGNRKPTRGSGNRADYSKVAIHLLEVKYTCDLRVHDMVEPALQQHEDLANVLRTAG